MQVYTCRHACRCTARVHTYTPSQGACWDKFRRVDLTDNRRATLINTGFSLPFPCLHCKSLHSKGWFVYIPLRWRTGRSSPSFVCESALEKQILSDSNIALPSHLVFVSLLGQSIVEERNLNRAYLHVTECEP